MQTFSDEIINSKSRNFVATGIYRPPKEEWKAKEKCKHKTIFMVGDLNIFNLIFQRGFLPLIRRATRITRTTATAIDHTITDAILESTIHSGIIKANISDHLQQLQQK